MKNIPIYLSSFLLLCISCVPQQLNPNLSGSFPDVVAANNDFGFRIFQKLHEADPSENMFISPLSISTALTMAYNGAAAETADAMAEVLGLDGLNLQTVNEQYLAMLLTLPGLDPDVQLDIANSIWYRKDFPVVPDFLTTNESYFQSEVNPLNFDNPNAPDIINDWVADNTQDKIKKIVETINAEDMMFLINAVYFLADWKFKFNKSKTEDRPFYFEDGTNASRPFMEVESDLTFAATNLGYMVDLPYSDSIYSMSLILPHQDISMDALIAEMNPETFQNWVDQLDADQSFTLRIPTFELEYKVNLNSVLSELGMGVAMTDFANFSGLSPEPVKISQVLHKTYLKLDEKGTEAAAVTSVGFVATSVNPNAPPPILTFDRPYLMIIRENRNNTVVFSGKIMDPPM